jgi:peptidoglycan/LPS O-acetylase OafA/YrhL
VVWGTALLGKTKRGPLALWALGMVLLTAPLGWLAAKYFSEPLNRRLRQS